MKWGFSTAALFPRSTLQALKLIGSCGFEVAEIMPQCRWETKPGYGKELIQKGLKVKICSIHFPLVYFPVFYNPYPAMQTEAKGLIDDLVEMARTLEAQVIVIHPPQESSGVKGELFYRAAVENIRYLCDRSEEAGIVVAVENSPQSLCKDPKGMEVFLKEIDRPNVYPMLDTTEAMKAGFEPTEFLKVMDPVHLHLSDYSNSKVHLPPGEGRISWSTFLGLLDAKGYRGCLILEPAYSCFLSEEKALRKMVEMRNFLERAWERRSG